MDLNLVQISFACVAVAVPLLGFVVKVWDPYLPIEIRNLFRYGRLAAEGKRSMIPTLEVPKRWSKHFYLFAAPASTCVLLITLRTYLGIGSPPKLMYQILDILLGENRKPLISPEHSTLALVLLTIHLWKRFYEAYYICIFSNGKFNIGHYMLGFFHYVGALLCIIGESEGFFEGDEPTVNWNKLTFKDYVCTVTFLWSSYKQLTCNLILANLRKNKKGQVVTLQHKVPKGGLFHYISSPLQSTEILIYFTLLLILWSSETYQYVFFWVLMNQMGTGLFGHWWYVETFKDYPKQRKALIPWIL